MIARFPQHCGRAGRAGLVNIEKKLNRPGVGVPARKNSSPSRHTNRAIGVSPAQANPFGGHLIHIGRSHISVTRMAHRPAVVFIRQNVDYVGLLGHWFSPQKIRIKD
jgi:hypothetical protein